MFQQLLVKLTLFIFQVIVKHLLLLGIEVIFQIIMSSQPSKINKNYKFNSIVFLIFHQSKDLNQSY